MAIPRTVIWSAKGPGSELGFKVVSPRKLSSSPKWVHPRNCDQREFRFKDYTLAITLIVMTLDVQDNDGLVWGS